MGFQNLKFNFRTTVSFFPEGDHNYNYLLFQKGSKATRHPTTYNMIGSKKKKLLTKNLNYSMESA